MVTKKYYLNIVVRTDETLSESYSNPCKFAIFTRSER